MLHTHRDPSPAIFHVPGSYPPPVSSQASSIEPADEREHSDDDDDEDEDEDEGDGDGDGPASCPSTPQHGSQSITAGVKAIITRSADVKKLEHRHGTVYIFLATHDGTPIVKIGSTTNQAETRKKSIKATCKILRLQSQPVDLPSLDIAFHLQHVERLAQAELQDFRYDFDCSWKKRHREWFAVDPAVAHHVVARWIRFLEQMPWDCHTLEQGSACTGPLKAHWRNRLEDWKYAFSSPAAERGLETRVTLWDRFVDASSWAVAWNDVKFWSRGLWQYVWQASLVLVLEVFAALLEMLDKPSAALTVRKLVAALLLCVALTAGGFKSWMAERFLLGQFAAGRVASRGTAFQGVR